MFEIRCLSLCLCFVDSIVIAALSVSLIRLQAVQAQYHIYLSFSDIYIFPIYVYRYTIASLMTTLN